jgi:hypothetical protein
MSAMPHPPCLPDLASCGFSLLPRFKIKLKCRHFDTIVVIEAKLLYTLTKLDFLEACKKWLLCMGNKTFLLSLQEPLSGAYYLFYVFPTSDV